MPFTSGGNHNLANIIPLSFTGFYFVGSERLPNPQQIPEKPCRYQPFISKKRDTGVIISTTVAIGEYLSNTVNGISKSLMAKNLWLFIRPIGMADA